MDLEYIFLRKTSKEDCTALETPEPTFESYLRFLFSDIEVDSFPFILEGNRYIVNYSYKYVENAAENHTVKNKVFVLHISSREDSESLNAEILEGVNKAITESSNRKYFYIITAFDEVSQYYCDMAFPYINSFERNLRNLVFLILTKAYGVSWTTETISPEIREKLKKQMRGSSESKLIEQALYEMDISTLECFLFEPTRLVSEKDISNYFDKELSKEALKNLTREEIVNRVNYCNTFILWDVCFAGKVHVADLKENISELRGLRNKVGHAKFLSKSEFTTIKNLSELLIPKLKETIRKCSETTFTCKQVASITHSFGNAYWDLMKPQEDLRKVLSAATGLGSLGSSYWDLMKPQEDLRKVLNAAAGLGSLGSSYWDLMKPQEDLRKVLNATGGLGSLGSSYWDLMKPQEDLRKVLSAAAGLGSSGNAYWDLMKPQEDLRKVLSAAAGLGSLGSSYWDLMKPQEDLRKVLNAATGLGSSGSALFDL